MSYTKIVNVMQQTRSFLALTRSKDGCPLDELYSYVSFMFPTEHQIDMLSDFSEDGHVLSTEAGAKFDKILYRNGKQLTHYDNRHLFHLIEMLLEGIDYKIVNLRYWVKPGNLRGLYIKLLQLSFTEDQLEFLLSRNMIMKCTPDEKPLTSSRGEKIDALMRRWAGEEVPATFTYMVTIKSSKTNSRQRRKENRLKRGITQVNSPQP